MLWSKFMCDVLPNLNELKPALVAQVFILFTNCVKVVDIISVVFYVSLTLSHQTY